MSQLSDTALQVDVLNVFPTPPPPPSHNNRYADLCSDLGKELPSFPPAEGDTKAITFKRVLLNTCQDEFEAAADARRVSAHHWVGWGGVCVGWGRGGGVSIVCVVGGGAAADARRVSEWVGWVGVRAACDTKGTSCGSAFFCLRQGEGAMTV